MVSEATNRMSVPQDAEPAEHYLAEQEGGKGE